MGLRLIRSCRGRRRNRGASRRGVNRYFRVGAMGGRAFPIFHSLGENPYARTISAEVPATAQAEQRHRRAESCPGKNPLPFIPSPCAGERISAELM